MDRFFLVSVYCKTDSDSAIVLVPYRSETGNFVNEKYILSVVFQDKDITFAAISGVNEISGDDYEDFRADEMVKRRVICPVCGAEADAEYKPYCSILCQIDDII